MTERLADISTRIEGVQQLGAVVNAMKGIAAARAHVARTQIDAVDRYAATIATALASVIRPNERHLKAENETPTKQVALLVFGAEQGFAGAFSERVLDFIHEEIDPEQLFLIGTRGISIAKTRGITPQWAAALPSHTQGIPKLADSITKAIYEAVFERRIDRLDVVFTSWVSGRPSLLRKTLFPIDFSDLPRAADEQSLTQLTKEQLIDSFGRDYFHSQVCKAALHAFAAENEARMEAMSSAGSQIADQIETFQAKLRRVRQEAITAEIIELSTGVLSADDAQ